MAKGSDVDSWVHPDYDDDGVLALSSGFTTPDCLSDDENLDLDFVLVLSSPRRRARSPSPNADADVEDLYELSDAEEVPEPKTQPPPPGPRPLSGLFHHTLAGDVNYDAFDPVLCWPEKVLIPDPTFSACGVGVKVLASNGGLVCLRVRPRGVYFVVNPATRIRFRLPRMRHHMEHGDPAVVITFEDTHTCCADHRGHYHVVVAYLLGDGVYGFGSFSSRAWQWTAGARVDTVGQVIQASGVGVLGRAFWRTTLGHLLCYNPAKRTSDLIPAPQEVLPWPYWEIGEMDGTLSITCMDERVNEVVIFKLHLKPLEDGAGEIVTCYLVGHFEGGCLRNRDSVQLLRSQGPDEVVMWDPVLELVVAMDTEGRTMRTIGSLSGHQNSDFIPYITSSTGIRFEAGAECMLPAADAEA